MSYYNIYKIFTIFTINYEQSIEAISLKRFSKVDVKSQNFFIIFQIKVQFERKIFFKIQSHNLKH